MEGGRVRACGQWLRSVWLCSSHTAMNSFSIDCSLYKTKQHSLVEQRSKVRAARPHVVFVNNLALHLRRPPPTRTRSVADRVDDGDTYEAQRV